LPGASRKTRRQGEKRVRLPAANSLVKTGRAPARLLATLAFLLAFAFQSFVAQTHIHVPGAPGGMVSAGIGFSAPEPAPDQSPLDDASNCPVCQVAMAMATAVGVAGLVLVQPAFIAVAAKPHELPRPASAAPAHAWTSRGPPVR
jgi:hypothetical protein